ncbi:hypothetical protein DPSP01_003623 [Paraphaeosphaeria sporulosa]|uniref:Ecp2 effector protein-like domain-containing protein n=1 Tax=Paraphaeosphaeria sporulosa TaxID=1460663 RepID=A0A177BXQ2_9PLEO|nr:uncharacterized protein CC84DRAFT_1157540 [Paraphaeosphaeria sporulosa]OAF99481.1 hypothetical protein CC84DRAFT_1157540 [Paraphaeosphaeria sporulosa]
MQFSSFVLALFGFLSTLVTASQCTGHKENAGYCTVLTYEDRTTLNTSPPSTSQCERSCKDVLTDAGDWIVSFNGKPAGYVQHMVNSDCSFSVGRGTGEPSDYQFYMDNQDIVDIIDEVNVRFGGKHGGRVSAQGTMKCQGRLATWYVD